MKRLLTFLLLCSPLFAAAQKTHTVAAKENFYSIARLYNVPPKELAAYNNLSFEKGLSIGQVIKIPATGKRDQTTEAPPKPAAPSSQAVIEKQPAANATGQPVYHTVAPKEGLYSISKKYGVSIADIKKWNQLGGDAISIGTNLIVGYGGTTVAATTKAEPKQVTQPVVQVKPAPTPDTKPTQVATTVAANAAVKEPVPVSSYKAGNGGFFAAEFVHQSSSINSRTQAGTAGIFKSTSGWQDGKYYCLHNTAPAGSIVKITNSSNQKVVYAKVLDLIPDLKQNNSLIIRISNAAAAELGAADATQFECSLQY